MTKEMNNLFNYISTRLIVLRRIFDNFTKLKTSMESHSLEIIYTDLQNYYCIFDNLAIRGNSDVELAIQIIKAIMSVSIIHPTNIGRNYRKISTLHTGTNTIYGNNTGSII